MSRRSFRAINACRNIRRLPDGSPINTLTRHLLLVLATYGESSWPSRDRIAADMGVSRSTVARRLAILRNANLLISTRRWNNSNRYQINLEAVEACSSRDTYDVSGLHPSRVSSDTLTIRTLRELETSPDDDLDDLLQNGA